ncbi:MAG TPA: protein jag, partial [Tissierellales bacterium]|nr:protein jag [Tissierellales bacterium]
YLLSLAVNKDRDEYLKVVLDTEGYRQKREETLKKLAKKMADKALYSKRPVKLEPMNPYERRIIHSALQNVSGVSTYSEGTEPYRRVVIINK